MRGGFGCLVKLRNGSNIQRDAHFGVQPRAVLGAITTCTTGRGGLHAAVQRGRHWLQWLQWHKCRGYRGEQPPAIRALGAIVTRRHERQPRLPPKGESLCRSLSLSLSLSLPLPPSPSLSLLFSTAPPHHCTAPPGGGGWGGAGLCRLAAVEGVGEQPCGGRVEQRGPPRAQQRLPAAARSVVGAIGSPPEERRAARRGAEATGAANGSKGASGGGCAAGAEASRAARAARGRRRSSGATRAWGIGAIAAVCRASSRACRTRIFISYLSFAAGPRGARRQARGAERGGDGGKDDGSKGNGLGEGGEMAPTVGGHLGEGGEKL